MKLDITSIYSNRLIKVSEFTLEDFRTISFMVENDSDEELHTFLISKLGKDCNAIDKFYALLMARIKFVNETVTFSGSSNVTVNLNVWADKFKSTCIDIRKIISLDDFDVVIDYPENLYYTNFDNMLVDSIYSLKYKNIQLEMIGMDIRDKYKILDKLSPAMINLIKTNIIEHIDDKVILMESKLDIPEIAVNFFNNTAYSFIKLLYNYYTYDDILELIFMLSGRINDVGYIISRNPRDLELLSKLYSEDVAKTNQETKLSI